MGGRTQVEDLEDRAFEYLVKCHELSGGDDSVPLDMDKVAEELGFEPQVKIAALDHLLERGLVRLLGPGDAISIISVGIAQIEAGQQ
jgi:hypothetical protein